VGRLRNDVSGSEILTGFIEPANARSPRLPGVPRRSSPAAAAPRAVALALSRTPPRAVRVCAGVCRRVGVDRVVPSPVVSARTTARRAPATSVGVDIYDHGVDARSKRGIPPMPHA
jgi:hypothetical protein